MANNPSRPFDPKVALLCGLLAVVFWLMNALNKDGYVTKLAYPLQVSYNDTLYIAKSPLPKRIHVNVSGNGWALIRKYLSFSTLPIEYTVLQPLKTKFLNTSALTDKIAEQVKDVKINYVVADTLDLDFDKRSTRKVRVVIDSLGISLRKPFVVSSLININPKSVTFEGPESLLKSLDEVLILKIPSQKIDSDFDAEIPLNYPQDPALSVSDDKIQVSFEVAVLQIPEDKLPKPKAEEKKGISPKPTTKAKTKR